jgi:hypothetical protein
MAGPGLASETRRAQFLTRDCVAHPALLTPTVPSQIIPGINPARVPVIPLEADRVIAHRARRLGPRRSLIHRQQASRLRFALAWLPTLCLAFFVARRARTSIAQPYKAPSAAMSIFPVDLEPLAGRLLHSHLRGRHRIPRQLRRIPTPRLFRADQTNPFVTHNFPSRARLFARLSLNVLCSRFAGFRLAVRLP